MTCAPGAAAAAVANDAVATFAALRGKSGNVQPLRGNLAVCVAEAISDLPSLMINAGAVCHLRLHGLVRDGVSPAVLDEAGTGLDEGEGHVLPEALLPQGQHPLEMAWTRTVIVFAAADDLLDLPGGKGSAQINRSDERRAHNTLVLCRHGQQQGHTLVCTLLILAGHVHR